MWASEAGRTIRRETKGMTYVYLSGRRETRENTKSETAEVRQAEDEEHMRPVDASPWCQCPLDASERGEHRSHVHSGASWSTYTGSWSSPPLASSSAVLILAMRLSSTPPARTSTQNNAFSQYNIIPILRANNSLFPTAEPPLSKFA